MVDALNHKGDLLDLLYSAPGESHVWNEFLSQVASRMGTRLGAFLSVDPSSQRSSIHSHFGWPADVLRRYEEYYGSKDAWYLAYKKNQSPGWIGLGSRLCSLYELEKTEFYADFLRQFDACHQSGVVIEEGAGKLAVLTLNRSKQEGDFDLDHVRFLTTLVPHLKRALHLHKKVLGWKQMASVAAYLADTLDVGLIGIDLEGRVCFVNRMAEGLLRTRKLLQVRQGRIIVQNSLNQATLDRLLKTATHLDLEAPAGGAITLSDGASSVHLSVLPYRTGDAHLPKEVKVFITISDPAANPASRRRLLCELFRLTPAEERISMLLASGLELSAIAERTRTTRHTVRSHLKSIYQKTNVSRQSQLVRLISLLPGQL